MALHVAGKVYEEKGIVKSLSGKQKEDFEEKVYEALEMIETCPNGTLFLGEIRKANCTVNIARAEDKKNTCLPGTQVPRELESACFREAINVTLLRDMITKLDGGHPAMIKWLKFFGSKDYVRDSVLGRYPVAHKKEDKDKIHKTDREMEGAIQLSAVYKTREDFNNSTGNVTLLQCGLIAYHLMDRMHPGKGINATAIWDPEVEEVGLEEKEKADWMKRPSWIALAHELIHAWRMVTGQCVFMPVIQESYYEEAMTVGLPPYHGCKYTENKFRLCKKEPMRSYYAQNTKEKSEHARKKHSKDK